jgi:hypothetical protein
VAARVAALFDTEELDRLTNALGPRLSKLPIKKRTSEPVGRRVALFDDLEIVRDMPVNTETLDGNENLGDENDSSAVDSTPGLPPVICFEDIFAQDEAHRSRLESIVERIEANENGLVADFTVDADEHQNKFIECPAETVRLLAPAGSGKTQSVVNRVLTQAARGQSLDRFLILTFDNAAGLSLREKLDRGIAAAGLKLRGTAAVQTLNKFGYQLLRGLLRDRVGRCEVGSNVEADRHESVRRALEQLKTQHPDLHRLLPVKLARRVYLDLISTLKN